MTEVQSLVRDLPTADDDHAKMTNHEELESSLIDVHRAASRAKRLRTKYEQELAKDDRERDHVREDMRSRQPPRL